MPSGARTSTRCSYKLYRKSRTVGTLTEMHELSVRLLDDKEREVYQLEQVWRIDEADIAYQHRIDGGSLGAFGEVWLGTYQVSRPLARLGPCPGYPLLESAEYGQSKTVCFAPELHPIPR